MISGTEVCTFCKPLFFSTEFDIFSQSSYAIIVLKERFPFKTARSDSMKRKNICAEAALREVARKNHTTVEEVRKEIRLAMIAAMCNPDPAIQKRWNAIPLAGDTLTPEDFITYVASQCR
jgi:galactokinase